ncbi:hypothetical protein GF325_14610, partial [Candidatus Bathyarchaeota archaeon]|nr:hypothetical protein [Candidatus Bathyarchaeota archaeon]
MDPGSILILDLTIHAFTLVPLLLTLGILFKRWWESVDGEGKRDMVRFLIFFMILNWVLGTIWSFIRNIVTGNRTIPLEERIEVSHMFVAAIGATGISLIAYLYKRESLYFASWFFFLGGMIYYTLTGSTFVVRFFMYVVSFVYVGYFWYAGIKHRDDKLTGLALFFTTAFFASAGQLPIPADLTVRVIQAVYGLLYA